VVDITFGAPDTEKIIKNLTNKKREYSPSVLNFALSSNMLSSTTITERHSFSFKPTPTRAHNKLRFYLSPAPSLSTKEFDVWCFDSAHLLFLLSLSGI
jgi:hypothetical protein